MQVLVLFALVAVAASQTIPWHLDRLDQPSPNLDGKYVPYALNDGADVVVYIIGTGIDDTHSDFIGDNETTRVTCVYDFEEADCHLGGRGKDTDSKGIGTMLASIVGGTVSGVAKNVLIRTVRVAPNSAAEAVPDDILAGMDAIMADYENEDRKGVVVAPISIEITPENNIPLILIDQKARDMRNAGLVIAASNGDSPGGTDQCQNYSPGRLQIEPGIIIAGGARIEYAANPVADYRSPNANYGSCPHCYAPAHDIFGAVPGDMFTTGDPNSGFAAGIVGGIAALLRSDCKDLTPAQVKDKLVDGWTNNMDMAYDLDGITALGPVCGVPPVDATPEPTCDPV